MIDVLIHGWDLASATGQPTDLDPRLVDACWQIVQPQLALLQGSGAFGSDYATDTEDHSQASLLAALGRKG